jgi:hypothetical protein
MILNSTVLGCCCLIQAALADSVYFTYASYLASEIYVRRPAKQVALYARLSMRSIDLSCSSSSFAVASGFDDNAQGTLGVVFNPPIGLIYGAER